MLKSSFIYLSLFVKTQQPQNLKSIFNLHTHKSWCVKCEVKPQLVDKKRRKGEFCRPFPSHTTNSRETFSQNLPPRVTAGEIQNFRRVKNCSCSPHSQFIIRHIYIQTQHGGSYWRNKICGGIQTIREENGRKIKNDWLGAKGN